MMAHHVRLLKSAAFLHALSESLTLCLEGLNQLVC